jgi:hypothetical protein
MDIKKLIVRLSGTPTRAGKPLERWSPEQGENGSEYPGGMARSGFRFGIALVAFAFAVGIAPEAHAKKVTPWFEYEQSAPRIDIPHVFSSSAYVEIVRVRVAGKWREVLKAEGRVYFQQLDPTAFEGGHAVFIRRGGGVRIYHEGSETPTELPYDECPRPEVSPDGRALLCFFPEDAKGDWRHSDVRVVRVRMERRDSRGALLDSLSVPVPEAFVDGFRLGATLIGWTAKGTIVIEAMLFAAEAGKSTFVVLALEPPAARELARRGPQGKSPSAPEWAKLIPGLVAKHPGAGD